MFLNEFSIFGLIYFLSIQLSYSQNQYFTLFDSTTGIEASGLYNGTRYYELYRNTNNNTLYFKSSDFFDGSVLYDDEPYFNKQLKFNINEDVLICKLEGDKSFIYLRLISEKVKEFTLENYKFVRLKNDEVLGPVYANGFFEHAYSGEKLNLFIKHHKYEKEMLNKKKVTFKFIVKNSYFLYYKNKYYKVESAKSIKKILPDLNTEVGSFFKANKLLLVTDFDVFMTKLISYLDRNLEVYNK